MKWLKRNLIPFLCSLFLIFLLSQMDFISTTLTELIEPKKATSLSDISPYKNNTNFYFVQNTNDFTPLSKGDIKNIIYTIVNSGWDNFTFYCPSEYTTCVADMKEISQDQELLTHINNFVHPFLSFSNIRTSLSESGEVTLQIERLYTSSQITSIEQKVDSYIKNNITDDMTLYDKIKQFHDAIINQTKYDIERNNHGESNYHSYLAYGPLFEGYATCNGYTDVMAIYLSKLGVVNYKIATTPTEENHLTEGHVWNAVLINDEWLHLDLTWDDPVSKDGTDYLQHKYFLIDDDELTKADEGEVEVLEHQYDKSIYLEFSTKKEL